MNKLDTKNECLTALAAILKESQPIRPLDRLDMWTRLDKIERLTRETLHKAGKRESH